MPTTFAGQLCVDPDAFREECEDQEIPTAWWGRVNVFHSPINGPGPGHGQILLTKAALDAIDQTTDHDLVFDDQTNPVRTFRSITLLRGTCLSPSREEEPNAPYICDLVDRRWHLARIPINRGYNISSAKGTAYLSASTDSGVTWTWDTLVQDLFDILDLGTATLPFSPDGTPENFAFFGRMAWEALAEVLDRLSCFLKYDPETDEFSILRMGVTTAAAAQTATTEIARLVKSRKRVWDGFWVEPARGRFPEKVRVLFARRPLPQNGSSPYYAIDITLPTVDGVEPGSFVQIHDDKAATGTGTPTNLSALTTRAQQRADDWIRRERYAQNRVTTVFQDYQKPGRLLSELGTDVTYDDRGTVVRTELRSTSSDSLKRWLPLDLQPKLDGDTGADCIRFIHNITSARCFSLAQVDQAGTCACITLNTAAVPLTWSTADGAHAGDADSLLYGCPPGVVTTWCPDGAPRKFTITVAGFTGGSAVLNGTYTLTWSSGETWTGTTAGVTATLIQTGDGEWLLSITDGTYVPTWFVTGITDCCSDIVLALDDNGSTTDPPATLTAVRATACGYGLGYRPYLFTCTDSCSGKKDAYILLVPQGGGSAARSIKVPLVGCGVDGVGQSYGEFATNDSLLCTDEEDGECDENAVRFRVYCRPCTGCNPNYFGPGWYKTLFNTCVYLDEDGTPDQTPCIGFAICSGPYAEKPTDAECAADCEISVAGCPCDLVFPGRFCLQVALMSNAERTDGGCVAAAAISGSDDYGIDGMQFGLSYTPTGIPENGDAAGWCWRLPAGLFVKSAGDYGDLYVTWASATILCNSITFTVGGEVRGGLSDGETWSVSGTATTADGGISCSGLSLGTFAPTPAEVAALGSITSVSCQFDAAFDTITLGGRGNDTLPASPKPGYKLTIDWHATPAECDTTTGTEESYNLVDATSCLCRDPGDGTGLYKASATQTALERCHAACSGSGGGTVDPTDCCVSYLTGKSGGMELSGALWANGNPPSSSCAGCVAWEIVTDTPDYIRCRYTFNEGTTGGPSYVELRCGKSGDTAGWNALIWYGGDVPDWASTPGTDPATEQSTNVIFNECSVDGPAFVQINSASGESDGVVAIIT